MLRLGYFPDEKLDKDGAFRLLTRFVFNHSGSMKRPIVEGTKGQYMFATRQNCLMYFKIDDKCTVFGSMMIDVIYGEYPPKIEDKINRNERVFVFTELLNYKLFEHPYMKVSLSFMDYRFDDNSFKVFQSVARENGLDIDVYDGLYPDGSSGKACSLEIVVSGIDTQGEFEQKLEDTFKKSKRLLYDTATRLNLIGNDSLEMYSTSWKNL